ncbi:peptide ABC transporter substrate-binding protein [Firmicutes bacterium AM43-11BH]|nr:peptide ABC transporter substrate-binding protein [Firmicutes bacterium AM43-11BH]
MKKKILSVILAAALTCSMVVGCGSSKETAKDDKAATSSSDGFNVTVNFASEPMTMDPALNSTVDGGVMANHLFEGLMKWQDTGEEADGSDGTVDNAELTYGQAESYDKVENEDGTVTYTFHLRDGIKWSDGKDVTAGDFEYAWKRLVDPATAADYSYMLDSVVNANEIIAGEKDASELAAKAVDDKTFEVTITTDVPYFEEICAFPAAMPVRQDIIEEKGDQWTFDPSTYISNGPYKLTEWTHNSQIVMAKNENYYDYENLGPDTITFKLMDDSNAMLSGFKSGELDFIQDAPQAELPGLIASGDMKILNYLGTYYVCFQTQKAPFDNPKVREAFTLAVDRTYIVNKVTQSGQVEAGGYVPSGISDADGGDFREEGGDYYKPTDADYEANCEKARQLLAEAGYPNGEGFPVVEYLYNTSDAHKAVAEALQNMWEQELGVTVTLNNQEWAAFLQTRKDGDYSIARNGWISDYNDPISFLDMWMTGGGNNDAQYANPEYDNIIKQAKATSDATERMKLLHQAEDILVGQDYVVDPLYFYTQKYMLADGIEGTYYCPLGYFFFGYTHQAN